jgi:hypothetical protein
MICASARSAKSSTVQQLVSGSAVERLDKRVLPGNADLHVAGVRAGQAAPLTQAPGHEFGTNVHAQVLRRTALGNQHFDDVDELVGVAGASDPNGESLASELVDDVGQLETVTA